MQTAPIQAVALPQHLLIGWVQVAQRLAELGVNIALVEMDRRWVTDLDEASRTLHVRVDADPEHQLWGLEQARDWLAGHASPYARVEPLLRLVVSEQRRDDPPA